MNYTFEVNYYTGKTSHRLKATLTLGMRNWEIIYTDPSTQSKVSVIWAIDKIHTAQTVSSLTSFKYDTFPHQSIDYTDESISAAIKERYEKSFFTESDLFIKNISFKKIAALLCCIGGFIACTYFYILPFLAVQMVTLIPKNFDEELGANVFENYKETVEIDSVKTVLINNYAEKIDFKSEYNIRIYVVNDSTVNAFALPGGTIVVYTGILNKMGEPEELAALLAHEVSHINHRHSVKNMAKLLSNYAFLSIVTSDVNGLTSLLLDNANLLSTLHYSRELEKEADAEGLKILTNNKINQKGFVDLFHTLEEESHHGLDLQLLSTHPLTKDRIEMAKASVAKQTAISNNIELQIAWYALKGSL